MTKLDIELLGFSSSLSSSHSSGFLWIPLEKDPDLKDPPLSTGLRGTKAPPSSRRSDRRAKLWIYLDLMTVRTCKNVLWNSGDREGADLIQAEAKIRLFGLVISG